MFLLWSASEPKYRCLHFEFHGRLEQKLQFALEGTVYERRSLQDQAHTGIGSKCNLVLHKNTYRNLVARRIVCLVVLRAFIGGKGVGIGCV